MDGLHHVLEPTSLLASRTQLCLQPLNLAVLVRGQPLACLFGAGQVKAAALAMAMAMAMS